MMTLHTQEMIMSLCSVCTSSHDRQSQLLLYRTARIWQLHEHLLSATEVALRAVMC